MEEMGTAAASPQMTAEVKAFLAADDEMKLAGRG